MGLNFALGRSKFRTKFIIGKKIRAIVIKHSKNIIFISEKLL